MISMIKYMNILLIWVNVKHNSDFFQYDLDDECRTSRSESDLHSWWLNSTSMLTFTQGYPWMIHILVCSHLPKIPKNSEKLHTGWRKKSIFCLQCHLESSHPSAQGRSFLWPSSPRPFRKTFGDGSLKHFFKSTIQCHTSIFVSSFWRDEHLINIHLYIIYIYIQWHHLYPS